MKCTRGYAKFVAVSSSQACHVCPFYICMYLQKSKYVFCYNLCVSLYKLTVWIFQWIELLSSDEPASTVGQDCSEDELVCQGLCTCHTNGECINPAVNDPDAIINPLNVNCSGTQCHNLYELGYDSPSDLPWKSMLIFYIEWLNS